MNILLLNTNPVVSRLVSLCMRDEDIVFEEVSHIDDVGRDSYDIVFIDDASYRTEIIPFLKRLRVGKVVFFPGRVNGEDVEDIFDTMIKKPFLPSQVQQLIDEVKADPLPLQAEEPEEILDEDDATDVPFLFPLSDDSEEEEETASSAAEETKVLDSREIEQIKALLDEEDEIVPPVDFEDESAYEARKVEAITQKLEADGLEIVEEEEILSELTPPVIPPAKRVKKKKKKRAKKQNAATEAAILEALTKMKPKKIRKLLRGAEVTIKIRFKDER